jgi:hypothetical protein
MRVICKNDPKQIPNFIFKPATTGMHTYDRHEYLLQNQWERFGQLKVYLQVEYSSEYLQRI